MLAIAGVVAAAVWYARTTGLSALPEASATERRVASAFRRFSIPAEIKERKNPVALSNEILAEGRSHFADHCAICHGNNGSGKTDMGRNLFPKAPDMRQAATQGLTDGELFWTIENGIRFTGMPGWSKGTAEGEQQTWHLVHFIRRLPQMTPEEIAEMEALNPRSPLEVREELENERFLQGADMPKAPSAHRH